MSFERGPDVTADILAAIERNNPMPEKKEDVVLQEQEEAVPLEKQEQQPIAQAEAPQKEAPWKESFQELRAKAERMERERNEAIAKLQSYDSSKQVSRSEQESIKEDDEINISDDSLVEGKHVAKLIKKIKTLESKMHSNQEQSAMLALETRLKTQYSDFDQVVNEKNFNELAQEYPEVAATIHSSTDMYSKAATAYKLIKKLGIGVAQPDPYQAQKEKINANATKPRAAATIAPKEGALGELSDYNGELTDELRDKLYRDMIKKSKTFY